MYINICINTLTILNVIMSLFVLLFRIISTVSGEGINITTRSDNFLFQSDYNFYNDDISQCMNVYTFYYTLNETKCMNGTLVHQIDSIPFDFIFNNCSDITLNRSGGNHSLLYSLSLNVAHNTSLIEIYYKYKMISHKTFYTHYVAYIQSSIKHFGLDEATTIKDRRNFKCKVSSNKWQCNFDKICLGKRCNDYYTNKFPVLFDPFASYFIVPVDFFNYIEENYYKDEIESGICKIKKINTLKEIECDESELSGLSLFFLYHNKGFYIKPGMFFTDEESNHWIISYYVTKYIDFFSISRIRLLY